MLISVLNREFSVEKYDISIALARLGDGSLLINAYKEGIDSESGFNQTFIKRLCEIKDSEVINNFIYLILSETKDDPTPRIFVIQTMLKAGNQYVLDVTRQFIDLDTSDMYEDEIYIDTILQYGDKKDIHSINRIKQKYIGDSDLSELIERTLALLEKR